MEPYPFHYTHRSRAGDSVDPTVKFVFEERLDDRIEGRRQGIDHRMADSEQRVEERLISLEMARMESETGRAEIEKQVEGLSWPLPRARRGTASNIIPGISSWGRLPAILRSRSTVRLSPNPTSMSLILLLSGFKVLLENLLE
jgi:hypothetical protein